MTSEWTLEGDYVEACNCDVSCQCIQMEPPDEGECTVSLAWHIREGHYGDVDLSGLSAAMLAVSGEEVMFAPGTEWDVVVLLDEAANDAQREALQAIYTGQAGGIFAAIVEAHVRSASVEFVPIDYARDGLDFSVEIPEILSVEAGEAVGFNGEAGTIMPHPLTADLRMNTGKSRSAVASFDDQFSWDVSGNNSFLGDFELANA